jgi:multidrug efflux pump subunit AcrB
LAQAESTSQRINLKTNSEAKTPRGLRQYADTEERTIVDIRLGDVAHCRNWHDMELNTSHGRYNQDQVVFRRGIYPEPGTSEIVVGDARLQSRWLRSTRSLPEDLELSIPFDNSRYMREAVAGDFSARWERPSFWWAWWCWHSWAQCAAP